LGVGALAVDDEIFIAQIMALRPGYTRFAMSVQYHGSSFLGFKWQKDQENCILPNGTDLRGYRSVEGRLREALLSLLKKDSAVDIDSSTADDPLFENIQVSSRTDRGVHALHNTLHVDVRNRQRRNSAVTLPWDTYSLHKGINFELAKQKPYTSRAAIRSAPPPRWSSQYSFENQDQFIRYSPMNELRVLRVKKAPLFMANPYFEHDSQQPCRVDWNARFSATERTYMYRILYSTTTTSRDDSNDDDGDNDNDVLFDWAVPFEWDRSWKIHTKVDDEPLNVAAMRQAGAHFIGTHDFSAFRAANCQRKSPIVSLHDFQLYTQPFRPPPQLWQRASNIVANAAGGGGLLGLGSTTAPEGCQLVIMAFRGNSFLYRQVRNMVGCLLEVGQGRLPASAVPEILSARDRSFAPYLVAPSHGLYLAHVKHGDFVL
jgi:tRNA U38,U39,U40 pseudouridine synthase TruA